MNGFDQKIENVKGSVNAALISIQTKFAALEAKIKSRWYPAEIGQLLIQPVNVTVASGAKSNSNTTILQGRGNVKRIEVVLSNPANEDDYDDITIKFLSNSVIIINTTYGTFFKPQYQNVKRIWDVDIPESAVVAWEIDNASASAFTVQFILHYV